MMQTKICPNCGAEYFAHVTECADCGGELKTPGEIKQAEAEKERFLKSADGEAVAIREGGKDWLKELRNVLLDSGISSYISLSPGCAPGSCNSTCLLLVTRESAGLADSIIRGHYKKTHPEMNAHEEFADLERCPACGHHAGADAAECPDCGLVLQST